MQNLGQNSLENKQSGLVRKLMYITHCCQCTNNVFVKKRFNTINILSYLEVPSLGVTSAPGITQNRISSKKNYIYKTIKSIGLPTSTSTLLSILKYRKKLFEIEVQYLLTIGKYSKLYLYRISK